MWCWDVVCDAVPVPRYFSEALGIEPAPAGDDTWVAACPWCGPGCTVNMTRDYFRCSCAGYCHGSVVEAHALQHAVPNPMEALLQVADAFGAALDEDESIVRRWRQLAAGAPSYAPEPSKQYSHMHRGVAEVRAARAAAGTSVMSEEDGIL